MTTAATQLFRSNDAVLNSDGTYTWQLQAQLDGAYRLVEVSLPNTAFPINSNNNTLTYIDSTGTHTITVPPGYYTTSTLATEVVTLMTAASTSGPITYTTSSNTNSTVLSIAGTAAFTLKFGTLASTVTPSTSLATILGFPNVDQVANSSFIVTGVFPPNLAWNQANYLTLSGPGISADPIYFGTTACTFIVPVTVTENNVTQYWPPWEQVVTFKSTMTLTLKIADDSGQTQNFQGGQFYFILTKRLTKEQIVLPNPVQEERKGPPSRSQGYY